MYSSIISNAVQQSVFNQARFKANTKSANGLGRRSGTVYSTYTHDPKHNIGLSTSSSMHSSEQMPHLVPQKTNVLTGASTKYYRPLPSNDNEHHVLRSYIIKFHLKIPNIIFL